MPILEKERHRDRAFLRVSVPDLPCFAEAPSEAEGEAEGWWIAGLSAKLPRTTPSA